MRGLIRTILVALAAAAVILLSGCVQTFDGAYIYGDATVILGGKGCP